MHVGALQISAANLQETEQKVLDVAVNIICDEKGKDYLVVGDSPTSEILVLNADTADGSKILNAANENQVKIVFSSSTKSGKNLITMPTPVRVIALKNVLIKICEQLYAYITSRETSHLHTIKKISPPPKNQNSVNIFQKFLQIKLEKKCYMIRSAGLPDIYLDGINSRFIIETNTDDVEKYLNIDFNTIESEEISYEQLNENSNHMPVAALNGILWRCALACSNGKLLPGHSENIPVKLTSWPNFSRQGFKPNYFKLAAIMAKQYISLAELNTQTQIPLEEIIDFYNASFAVDIIATNSNKPDSAKLVETKDSKQKSILKKLAQRLGIS
ncbi:hypothetical protein MNBD_GAMMA23-2277 [hydrothermal vent metagenome]|uniref:Uncharacterized protein n=1 Tax=hydrothermal vent metagenome TaxID=652676 RepID=A0A3B0ZS17_9ZZZZ